MYDYKETEVADADNKLLSTIVERYQQILDEEIELQSKKALKNEVETSKKEHEALMRDKQSAM